MAASIPSQGFPVVKVTMKAVTAPADMSPSIPRLMIPPLSETISPRVARSSGVPAMMVRVSTETMRSSMNGTPEADSDAMADEKVSHDEENQDHSVEDIHRGGGHPHGNLDGVSTDYDACKEEP